MILTLAMTAVSAVQIDLISALKKQNSMIKIESIDLPQNFV
jgi:hypothetical protein